MPAIFARCRRAGALCLVLGATSCAFFPALPLPKLDRREDAHRWTIHRIDDTAIRESSGLVRSRRHAAVFWTHNDSGDEPRIFAITPTGEVLAQFEVDGADHRDWEDIAIDDAGNLFVADVGNNTNRRRDLVVYRIPEPDPRSGDGHVRADLSMRLRYADQRGFPRLTDMNFDAEAMFWMEGSLYIFTKHRNDCATKLYRLPVSAEDAEVALEPIQRFDLPESCGTSQSDKGGFHPTGNVTGADLHPDGRRLALISYRAIFLFEREVGEPHSFRRLRVIRLQSRRTRMAESIAWDGDELLFGNEQRHLFRIPNPMDPALETYPPPLDGASGSSR